VTLMTSRRTQPALHGPVISYVEGERIEEIIADWAHRQPQAPALHWHGGQTSYRELVDAGQRIGAALIALGVAPDDVVAVQMERTPRLIAILLGILQAGAAYLTLPTEWPSTRCENAMAKVKPKLCISEGAGLAGVSGSQLVHSRTLLAEAARQHELPTPGRAKGLGCSVFSTSGTTGTPKMVLSTHRGTIRIARHRRLRFSQKTNMLQAASVAWDGFPFELWCPLLNGGSSFLYEGGLLTASEVKDSVQQGVNTLFLTPTLFNAFLEDAPEIFEGVEVVITGGERMSPKHALLCRQKYPDLILLNAYGPVESTMMATLHEVTSVDEQADIPIGHVVANTDVYLLDEQRQIVPSGQKGEIAIGGDGLAVGYLGDEQETADKFVYLPLGPVGAQVRVYLTGDIGRLSDDGALRFLGRKDRQVKIRGVRIEPSEVEQIISRLPGVGQTAVLATPVDGEVKQHLVAFYTTTEIHGPRGDQIRRAVAASLPEAFVPSFAIEVSELPVTSIGKVDARTLEALLPENVYQTPSPNPSPTANGLLAQVLDHVQDLLQCKVGANDNIFERGGSSLSAVRLAGRLGEQLGVEVSAIEIMRWRTPLTMASQIRTRISKTELIQGN
jgi:amino acid adenylation domain-containing protein